MINIKKSRIERGEVLYLKKVGFITTNKVLAQSLVTIIKGYSELKIEAFMLLNPHQAALDAEVLKIDVAVVDINAGASDRSQALWSLCETLRQTLPKCRILLFVPQDDKEGLDTAMEAIKEKAADDFVFYGSSLDYLFAKLVAFLKIIL